MKYGDLQMGAGERLMLVNYYQRYKYLPECNVSVMRSLLSLRLANIFDYILDDGNRGRTYKISNWCNKWTSRRFANNVPQQLEMYNMVRMGLRKHEHYYLRWSMLLAGALCEASSKRRIVMILHFTIYEVEAGPGMCLKWSCIVKDPAWTCLR